MSRAEKPSPADENFMKLQILTDKEARFVDEYPIDMNGGAAGPNLIYFQIFQVL